MRLLIISSSQRQISDPNTPIPALERYDGFVFRILRRLKREGQFPNDLDVLIVSSKFGLLSLEDKISYPDQLMTFEVARQHRSDYLNKLKSKFGEKKYSEIFVNLGAIYAQSIRGFNQFTDARVIYASGGLGKRAKQIRQWILSTPT